MIVTCPNCDTKFNLPDSVAAPGASLRCSVCKHVFTLPMKNAQGGASFADELDGIGDDLDGPAEKKKRPFPKGLVIGLVVLLLLGGTIWGLWHYTSLFESLTQMVTPKPEVKTEDLVKLIALREVRQYNINNEKVGNICVIEGRVVNGFNEPRELIRIEAALYDSAGVVLVSKQQLVGTSVSLFQLQVLGEQELEQALSNKIDILTNNTNVAPGAEVPFMAVFYNPPDNAAEFGINVIDARVPPQE